MLRIEKYFLKLENTKEITDADKMFVQKTLSGFTIISNWILNNYQNTDNNIVIDDNFERICKFYIGNSVI